MEWRGAPATVWGFIALMVLTLVVAALPGDPIIGRLDVAIGLTVLWAALLLRRSTNAWWILVALYGFVVLLLLAGTAWPMNATLAITIMLTIGSFAALLAPATRRWVGVAQARRSTS